MKQFKIFTERLESNNPPQSSEHKQVPQQAFEQVDMTFRNML